MEDGKKSYISRGILAGLLEGVYIFLVGLFMFSTEGLYDSSEVPVMNVVVMLTLFVFSAGVSGLIVFGYPVLLVTKQRYAEAVKTVVATLATLLTLFVIVFAILFFS